MATAGLIILGIWIGVPIGFLIRGWFEQERAIQEKPSDNVVTFRRNAR